MAASKEEILEAIANMTVMEVVELIEAMEEKFGVTAAAAVAAVAVGIAAGGGAGRRGAGQHLGEALAAEIADAHPREARVEAGERGPGHVVVGVGRDQTVLGDALDELLLRQRAEVAGWSVFVELGGTVEVPELVAEELLELDVGREAVIGQAHVTQITGLAQLALYLLVYSQGLLVIA